MTHPSQRRMMVTPSMLAAYDEAFEPLRQAGVEVIFNNGHYPMNAVDLARFIGDAEMAIVGLDTLSAEVFAACPRLKIVARNGIGLDNVDLDAASAHGVIVTVPFGANSVSVAELAFGLMLALHRQIVAAHKRVECGIWRREIGVELAEKTLGIIGLGRIGKQVARRALAFDMRVIANDIAPDHAFAGKYGISFVSLDELLRAADIVSLHVPLTPLTQHMIDAQALRSMKRGAALINTARGPVVDAQALADALDEGLIAGAALDVHTVEGQVEPFLLNRDDVVVTTHLGAYTHESLMKTTRAAAQSLLQYIRQEPLESVVNPAALPAGSPVFSFNSPQGKPDDSQFTGQPDPECDTGAQYSDVLHR